MNDAAIYRRTDELLRAAKLSGWRISRRVDGDDHWRLTSPGGATVTVAARPSLRGLMDAERLFARIEGEHLTAGTRPAS